MFMKLASHARDYIVLFLVAISLYIKSTYLNAMITPDIALDPAVKRMLFCITATLLVWALLLPKRWRAWAWLAVALGFTGLIFADLLYYRYYSDIFAVRALLYSSQLGNMLDSIKTLYQPEDRYLFFDLLALLAYAVFASFRKFAQSDLPFKTRGILVLVCLVVTVSMPLQFLTEFNEKNPNKLTSLWDRVAVGSEIGMVTYQMVDGYNLVREKITAAPVSNQKKQELADWLREKNTIDPATTKYHGIAKGKNLIVVQVEALQNFVIGRSINGQELTPNLNRLAKESVYFSNTFVQTSMGNTSDAEFIMNTSMYPARQGAAFVQFAQNRYNSLGNLLKAQGYQTSAMHAYTPLFWNRKNMYEALGYDTFYSFADYKLDETVGLGVSDRSFLKQSMERLKTSPQPFFSTLITLSSHFPFNDTKGYGEFNVSPLTGTLLGNYLMSAHYADAQLGMFIDELKRSGLWDRSVVLIYGDHAAIPKANEDELYRFLQIEEEANMLTWQMYQQIPAFLHVPNLPERGTKTAFSGQMDFLPTVANVLGMTVSTALGQDLLNPHDDIRVFRNGSFITSKYFYSSIEDKAYDIATGKETDRSLVLDALEVARTRLETSDLMLEHDLIPELNERLNESGQ